MSNADGGTKNPAEDSEPNEATPSEPVHVSYGWGEFPTSRVYLPSESGQYDGHVPNDSPRHWGAIRQAPELRTSRLGLTFWLALGSVLATATFDIALVALDVVDSPDGAIALFISTMMALVWGLTPGGRHKVSVAAWLAYHRREEFHRYTPYGRASYSGPDGYEPMLRGNEVSWQLDAIIFELAEHDIVALHDARVLSGRLRALRLKASPWPLPAGTMLLVRFAGDREDSLVRLEPSEAAPAFVDLGRISSFTPGRGGPFTPRDWTSRLRQSSVFGGKEAANLR